MTYINCKNCDKLFKVWKSRIGKINCCTVECSKEYRQKIRMKKTCKECGIDFNCSRNSIVYCSEECRHKNKYINISCPCCSNDYQLTKSKYEYRKAKSKNGIVYCSRNCSYRDRMKIKELCKTCSRCNQNFYTYDHAQKCCSVTCALEHRTVQTTITKTCANCHINYEVKASEEKWKKLREHVHYFCSVNCFKQHNRGEAHHAWIKDRSKIKRENKSLRANIAMKEWREKVFERDLYTCKWCDTKGIYIEAHHIIPVRENKKLMHELTNGITLCRPCHIKTFKKESQYVEFFKTKIFNENIHND
jgi:hypothetical protein